MTNILPEDKAHWLYVYKLGCKWILSRRLKVYATFDSIERYEGRYIDHIVWIKNQPSENRAIMRKVESIEPLVDMGSWTIKTG